MTVTVVDADFDVQNTKKVQEGRYIGSWKNDHSEILKNIKKGDNKKTKSTSCDSILQKMNDIRRKMMEKINKRPGESQQELLKY